MSKRKQHSPEFKVKVALEVEQTVAELASQFGINPTMIHTWRRALLEGASGVFERGGKKAPWPSTQRLHKRATGGARKRDRSKAVCRRCPT